jgi:hypothetical protein
MGAVLKSPKVIVRAPSIEARIMLCRGADWNDSFQIKRGGIPLDLTDKAIQLVIAAEHDSTVPWLLIDSRLGDIFFGDDPLQGKVQIYVAAGRLDGIPLGEWRHHSRIIADGESQELMRGPMIMLPARY